FSNLQIDEPSEAGPENDIGEYSPDSSSQSEEREEDAQPMKSPLHFVVPLPLHKWVQMVDPPDDDTGYLSYAPRSRNVSGCFDPSSFLDVPSPSHSAVQDLDEEQVGFDALPNQVQRKSLKKGFEFTLMVVGESGLGKSTLINSLLLRDLYKDRTLYDAQERIYQTVAITKKTVDIVEKGVKLRLSIVDTPGFGDAMDNTKSFKAVLGYIDHQFEQYRRGEVSLNRRNIQDNRVHCCLYFISPYGHGLKPIDVEFMKALHEKVNIVPVLAKADCLTLSEIQYMKTRILNELSDYRIKIFQFPECDPEDDELFKKQHLEMKMSIPFAVVGSNTTVEINGRRLRVRHYPWGVVEVDNPAHCDFVHLKNMLVCTHMQDLKDTTEDLLYENYRMQFLCRRKSTDQESDD
ncbi:hypothetical protein NFI96_020849, partial [Prochilodus magdalenae]